LRYIFENHALDTDRRELRCGTDVVPVAPQVFDLLDYLVRNRERVVGKDELIAVIWEGRIVSDSALTTRMNVARHAIGDSGKEQRLIKTVMRKGFRFVGAVREGHAPAALSGEPTSFTVALSPKPTLAVLPFANLSGDPRHERLADGIAEDVLTELAKQHWLIVAARNSSLTYRQKADDVRQIGSAFNVRYVLEGTVRRVDDRIRITGRLVDATIGVHIWAARYDRPLTDVFAADGEITGAIVSAVMAAVIREERLRAMRKPPRDLDAWGSYQLGMWHMSRCEPAENELARAFFQRSIDLDPTFAPGHGALAWTYMMAASIFSQMSIAEGYIIGEPLVRKAVALDENDLHARARLAIASLLQGDLEGAFEQAEHVLSVNAACAEALGVKGAVLVYSGRGTEGREAVQQHLQLSPSDPARPIRLSQIATSLYLDGRYDAAAVAARRAIRQYPKHPTAYRWLAASLGQLGRAAEAEVVLERLQTMAPSSFDMYVRQRPQYCSIEHAPMLVGLRKAGWRE
jgi:TolB-like protein/cytochrome c-type biogenesis protein CcmH/NrfG